MARKISQLEAAVDITANDLIQIVDVEDGDMAPSGTNKKATAQLLANELGKLTDITSTGSAIARSIESRFADIVNVKDFGAIGDGIANDSNAFISALNSNSSAALIPPGNYYIPNPSAIAGNTPKLWFSSNAFFRTEPSGQLLPFSGIFYGEVMPRDFGPIAVANDNIPESSGQNAGLKVITGKFPSATPGLNDRVAATFSADNINKTTSGGGIWGINVLALQNSTNSDSSTATDSMTRAAEFEVSKVLGGTQTDPWSGSSPYRANGIEIVGHNGSVYQPTAALTTWANDSTGVKWWQIGAAISRVTKWGILFKQNPSGSSDSGSFLGGGSQVGACIRVEGDATSVISSAGSHVNIIDLSGAAGSGVLVRMPLSSTGTAGFRNFSNFNNRIEISSGDTASQQSSLLFSHAGSLKWQIGKLSDDRFSIYGATNNVTPLIINENGDVGINLTSAISASSVFEISSTTKGFLPPRMTTTQRDSIASPAAGLIVYNTTTNLLNFYNGTTWGSV